MSEKNNFESEKLEYEQGITLLDYQTNLLWLQFNAILLIETVLVGFLGTALSQGKLMCQSQGILSLVAILGVIICYFWLATFAHNYEYYRMRIYQARRHEGTLGLNLLSEGKEVHEGKEIRIDNETVKIPWWALVLGPQLANSCLIVMFAVTFIVLAVAPWRLTCTP